MVEGFSQPSSFSLLSARARRASAPDSVSLSPSLPAISRYRIGSDRKKDRKKEPPAYSNKERGGKKGKGFSSPLLSFLSLLPPFLFFLFFLFFPSSSSSRLAAGHKLQRHPVHAVPQPRRPRPVGEDVSQVPLALDAVDLCPPHEKGVVDALLDRGAVRGERREERGPAGPAVELGRAREQPRAAPGTRERSLALLVVERAREGALGAVLRCFGERERERKRRRG